MGVSRSDEAVVERMALREAAVSLLVAPDQPPGVVRPPAPDVEVRVVACPACGAGASAGEGTAEGTAESAGDRAGGSAGEPDVPFAHWTTAPAGSPPTGLPVLRMLGCEWLTPRAVLPLAVAVEREPGRAAWAFRTRGVARVDGYDTLPALDESERWADLVVRGAGLAPLAGAELTLPAVTRSRWGSPEPLFAGPHAPAELAGLGGLYLAVRLRAVERALDEGAA
ncbi:hypothetical protein JOL79_03080 [Microbispora sp. RL4-1S]|uniref:Uncharacterized protein n=1 Tax=Microbispora oryzae TaxID=2806554 RepID=A0A940WC53_9ACTN|nr:hypothetical protein [Microbispora oryzae]MBP2702785.1 hypothetical protein [Microbispora oryzae]